MSFYLLGLGSNIEPEENLNKALNALTHEGDLIAHSPAVLTAPVGDTFSQIFGNQLAILKTELPAPMLKQRLQRIEESLGREPKSPGRKTRDRTIDIDILSDANDPDSLRREAPDESYYAEVHRTWNQELNV
ncbi:MAG: 2-amino-4-hydroxy-6-hydroxymethyldihydropteridine diphosphokinase [Pseudomonadota bacterium]|nr:2-amino-4-hydroxy-6-hydroxymethyldihydropteridine diphosphokinase [Pseudomonadota bacterium]MEC8103336.1 2-amino-4-hydroxy-6-hydroxymethyldihydropteridine diphosphokinase [Pseudomonadota bacterium]MEC8524758.1 2-amino-4-hydroxy-6-hydroxymethyldihydropteridine diphosphokinase [Pseudomonadota bacterium]